MTSHWPLFLSAHLAKLGLSMSISPKELLYGHTVFPYSTARMGRRETERLAKNIIERDGKSLTVLVQSASIGRGAPKFCNSCVVDDLKHLGETYWHRRHNLPFIQRCSVHGELLLAPPLRNTSKGISVTKLPEECTGEEVYKWLPESLSSALMQLSIDCLDGRARQEELAWRREYRRIAEAHGYPRQGTGLSSSSVLASFKSFYGDEFLASAGLNFDPLAACAWPILLLRSGYETSTSTPRHLLLHAFLENSSAPIPIRANQPGKKPKNLPKADELLAKRVREVIAELPPGTRITVTELMKRAGGWAVFRHNRKAMPRTNQVVQGFRISNFSERQVGRRPYWRKRLGLEK